MNFALRVAVIALPLLLLAGTPAAAEQTTAPQGSREAEVRTGLICDTQEQVERFISLYDGDMPGTVKKVNDAEGNPTACGVAYDGLCARAHARNGAAQQYGVFTLFRSSSSAWSPTKGRSNL